MQRSKINLAAIVQKDDQAKYRDEPLHGRLLESDILCRRWPGRKTVETELREVTL